MHHSKRATCGVFLSLLLAVGGVFFYQQPAHAGLWPFGHKDDDGTSTKDQADKPPPGMTEVDDGSGYYAKDFDKDETRSDKDKDEKPKKEASDPAKGDTWDKDPDFHYRAAKRYVARGERDPRYYKDALLEINKCLTLKKDYMPARFLGAYVLQLQGRYSEAIPRYRDYLKAKPEDQQAHVNLGAVLRHEGQYDEAEDEYRKAIEINGTSLQAHYNLANLLIERNDLEEALKELHACEKIAPSNAWVHNNLGVIYQRRDYPEEAEQQFSKAASLDPNNKTFELNLGLIRDQIASKRKTAKSSVM